MTSISHRDRRAFRETFRLLTVVTGAVVGLVALGMLAPWPWAGLMAVVAFAVVATGAVWASQRLVATYEADLRAVRSGRPVGGWLRAEVLSRTDLPGAERRSPRSPHHRPLGVVAGLDGDRR